MPLSLLVYNMGTRTCRAAGVQGLKSTCSLREGEISFISQTSQMVTFISSHGSHFWVTLNHKYWLHLTLRVDLTIDLMIYSDRSAFGSSKHAHILFSSVMKSILSDCNLDIQLCLSPYCPNFIKHQDVIFAELEKQWGHWFQLETVLMRFPCGTDWPVCCHRKNTALVSEEKKRASTLLSVSSLM